jgi:hypothetical protein
VFIPKIVAGEIAHLMGTPLRLKVEAKRKCAEVVRRLFFMALPILSVWARAFVTGVAAEAFTAVDFESG